MIVKLKQDNQTLVATTGATKTNQNTTMNKDLKEKAVDIKGKKYVLVADRVLYFNESYQNGSIETFLVSHPDAERVIVKARVTPDCDKSQRYFTGYSQATIGAGYINKTAALENAETSSVGRALALMGIGVIDSIASVDEIKKAQSYDPKKDVKEKSRIDVIEDMQDLNE